MAAALAVVALVRGVRSGFYTDVGIVVVQCNSENVKQIHGMGCQYIITLLFCHRVQISIVFARE